MAAKKISRARKRDLQDPDEFVTFWTKFFDFTAQHKIKVLSLLSSLVVLVVVAALTVFFLKKSESKAFSLLHQGLTKYEALVDAGNPEKAYLEAGKDFGRIMKKYSGRNGGKLAAFTYAEICYAAGDFDKAISNYNKSLEDFNDEPFFKNLILNDLAYSYMEKKDYKTSAKYFEMIVTTADYGIKDEALFNLGELYAALGDKDKSIDAFKKILSDHSGSMYTEIAKEKVAWYSKS